MTEPGFAHATDRHPTFTNAHAQMCAVITAITRAWGDDGTVLVRATYRDLGHQTGQQMIATGVVPPGADLETYGRVSEQIMDICGLEGWTRLHRDDAEHRTVVPGCAAYLPLFEFLDAPPNICSLPFEWDNGCLDVINADLQIWPTTCAYQGAEACHYVISARADSAGAQLALPAVDSVDETVAVRDEPTWTNPTAGFLALIGAVVSRYHDEGMGVLRPALHALGVRAGQEELADTPSVRSAAEILAARYRAAGFVGVELRVQPDDSVLVDLGANPYGPVLGRFSAREAASTLLGAYDAGWSSTVPGLELTTVSDGWLQDTPGVLRLHAGL
ncbi:hypothetical protein [Nocardioides soli]|uniref:Uncharacterized protein n=1 Tax=Nocardioides soli TaxID=1036020 RepID=A0A7W4VWI1_9ACTN|nr:hypothetical protein [Nocardioides soli]MBB3043106.1 hypothetical protein [Nocardioides soli]